MYAYQIMQIAINEDNEKTLYVLDGYSDLEEAVESINNIAENTRMITREEFYSMNPDLNIKFATSGDIYLSENIGNKYFWLISGVKIK